MVKSTMDPTEQNTQEFLEVNALLNIVYPTTITLMLED